MDFTHQPSKCDIKEMHSDNNFLKKKCLFSKAKTWYHRTFMEIKQKLLPHPSAFILDQILEHTNMTNHAKWHDNQNGAIGDIMHERMVNNVRLKCV